MAVGRKTPKLEFKSGDDAWYDVSIELSGSYLKVHYEEFEEDDDEMLSLEEQFKTVEDVMSRFRFSSKQLQDHHCEEVKEGMPICASCSMDGDDNRFFDAVVEQVHRSKHHLVDGEEQCTCTFKVLWKAGPVANQRTSVSCENICLLTAGSIETHPVTIDLLRLVEKNIVSRTRSAHRNPLRSKRTNTKGTTFEDRRAQPGERTDERHMACETPNRRDDVYLSSAKEVSDSLGSISSHSKEKEKKLEEHMACETPNSRDEVYLSNTKEVSNSLGSISSHSKEKEKKLEEVSATENVLTDYKVLLHERVASDNELKSSVESESDVGSETNISRYSHRNNTLKEDGIFRKITNLEGENDMCKKDSLPPDVASLPSQNKNFQLVIVPKNSKEATIDAEILKECKETNLNMERKEQKPNLPDLNSLSVELETMCPYTGSVSVDIGYNYTAGNNVYRTDQEFRGLDDNALIIEDVRPCQSGWLEAEDCDNLPKECADQNVVCNGIDYSERINKQLTMGENQKGQEITEGKIGKKHFLASWGRGKRHKQRNEMLVSERLVQDSSQKVEDTKALKSFLQPTNESDGVDTSKPLNRKEPLDRYRDECGIQDQTLQNVIEIGNDVDKDKLPIKHLRSNKVQAHEVSLGALDNKTGTFANGAIDALKSSCLTTSSMKPIMRNDLFDSFTDLSGPPEQTVKEPPDCFRDKCRIQDQTLQDVEEIGKDVCEAKPPVKHVRSNEVPSHEVSLGAVNNKNGEFVNVDIDALKSNCLTTSFMKPIKRKDAFDNFKDPNGPPEQPMKKLHIDVCAPRHKEFDRELSPPEVLPETVVISSDDENDHSFTRKEHDYGSNDFSRQHTDHVHLQKGVNATVDAVSKFDFFQRESCKRRKRDKMYHTSVCKGHINESGINEDKYYCTCRLNCQKNISATQGQGSGHFLSEKYNRSPGGSDSNDTPSNLNVDLQRYCFHSTSKYCEQPSHGHMNELGMMKDTSYCTCTVKGQKNVSLTQHQCNRHSLSEKWNHCSSGGPSHSKGDLQNFCFHSTSEECVLPSNGHVYKDLKVEEREFSLSEVLVLDNLEKDASCSDVIKIMSIMACNIVQVYIFPCLKFEKFTRGLVWFKDHTSLTKAYALLQDDNLFIVSSNGRPWVVIDTEDGVCEGIFGGFTVISQGSKLPSWDTSASEKVYIVRKGERAYEKAKRRRDAFLEFRKQLAVSTEDWSMKKYT